MMDNEDKKVEVDDSAERLVEDIDKNSEEIEKNEGLKKKQSKQLIWAIFLMVSIILIIVAVPFIKTNFMDKFEYHGMSFQKTKLGDLVFYSVRFPVVSGTGQVIGDYSINFRNDPRKLDKIPVNTEEGKIQFSSAGSSYNPVYITINPFMESCGDTVIAMATLAGFLRDSGLEVSSAVTDKAYSRDNNLTHRWCDTAGFDTVIVINNNDWYSEGNATEINELDKNCYEIKFNNCEIMPATERFILVQLEEYASRFQDV